VSDLAELVGRQRRGRLLGDDHLGVGVARLKNRGMGAAPMQLAASAALRSS
jgi:hypothetical protein